MQRLPVSRALLDPIKQEKVAENGKVRESREIVEERLWKEFFQDPSLWWDTRGNKRNPSYPDFKHAAKGHSIWIDSWFCPQWVATKLDTLELPEDGRNMRARYRKVSSARRKDANENLLDSKLEPLATFERLRLSGSSVSVPVIISALKACTRSKNLQAGKTIHQHVAETGEVLNKFVSSTLVGFYAKCGSMEDAKRVFEGTAERDTVLWNSMIYGYADCGQGKQGLETYHRMLDDGCQQDHITFLAALKSCLSLVDKATASSSLKSYVLEEVKALHAQARKTGNEQHIYLGNSLVDLYAKCGSMLDARRTFDRIQKKSLVSWTTIVSAYAQSGDGEVALRLYKQMLDEGFEPDALTFVAALKACGRAAEKKDKDSLEECLSVGKGIHDRIVDAGLEQHIYVACSLVDMYSKCGSLVDARNVFELMEKKGVVSWTSIIMGYAENGEADTALEMFSRMQESGVVADGVTYLAALKACSSLAESEFREDWSKLDCLNKVREIHTQARAALSEMHLFVASALVDAFAKCGSMADAQGVFESMKTHNVVSWTGIIQGYAENGEGEKALELFARLQNEGCSPDAVTFVAAFRACIAMCEDPQGELKPLSLRRGKSLYSQAIKAGFDQNKLVEHIVVEMYCKCGAMDHARRLFEDLKDLQVNAAPWNYMILTYAESGDGSTALEIYHRMLDQGCSADAVTYGALLRLCAALVALETGKRTLAEIFNSGFHKKVTVMNSAIDFYGKCGSLPDAVRVFEWMEKRDVVTWNSLLDVYSRCGDARSALEVFERMKKFGNVAPSGVTYLIVLTVCSHAGLVDEGMRYFEEMEEVCGDSGVGVKHCTCVVDMLGRANRLDEALEMINKSSQVDGVMWKALLDAARKWKDEEIGTIAFESVRRFEKHDNLAAPYVLMANTYI